MDFSSTANGQRHRMPVNNTSDLRRQPRPVMPPRGGSLLYFLGLSQDNAWDDLKAVDPSQQEDIEPIQMSRRRRSSYMPNIDNMKAISSTLQDYSAELDEDRPCSPVPHFDDDENISPALRAGKLMRRISIDFHRPLLGMKSEDLDVDEDDANDLARSFGQMSRPLVREGPFPRRASAEGGLSRVYEDNCDDDELFDGFIKPSPKHKQAPEASALPRMSRRESLIMTRGAVGSDAGVYRPVASPRRRSSSGSLPSFERSSFDDQASDGRPSPCSVSGASTPRTRRRRASVAPPYDTIEESEQEQRLHIQAQLELEEKLRRRDSIDDAISELEASMPVEGQSHRQSIDDGRRWSSHRASMDYHQTQSDTSGSVARQLMELQMQHLEATMIQSLRQVEEQNHALQQRMDTLQQSLSVALGVAVAATAFSVVAMLRK